MQRQPSAGRVLTLAEEALRARLRNLSGDPLDRAGRVKHLADAFVPGIPPEALEKALDDVRQGDGSELRTPKDPTLAPRFHSARSSCALAVNTFGPWRSKPTTLRVFGASGFEEVRFERKCLVMGVYNRRPPNLDVLAQGSSGVLAIESKLIEYLGAAKPASVEEAYDEAIDALAHSSWRTAIDRLRVNPRGFRHFGASQVAKHYLGLKSCFPDVPVRLIYLFWEPTDRERHALFAQHRDEVADFSSKLSDPSVSFESATYSDLFREWDEQAATSLTDHLRRLRSRYELAIFS